MTNPLDAPHFPVMLEEVIASLRPQDGETYIDGTFGAGGYTRAILEAAKCHVYGFDRDPSAIETARDLADDAVHGPRFTFIPSDFGDMKNRMTAEGINGVDAIILDLGVSSMQIDQGARGFSFQKDGALDMRMDNRDGSDSETAAELIARISEEDLANILYTYGDEKKSRRIAKAIKAEQAIEPITTTLRLAQIIEKANPQPPHIKTHAATKSFQALRIAVNDELGQLERALAASLTLLNEGGRLIVVTFHSLEDRLVKRFLKRYSGDLPSSSRHMPDLGIPDTTGQTAHFTLPHKKALEPSKDEVEINARSRSARLRCGIRTATPFTEKEVVFDA